jgi:hypothetical protein
VPRFGPKPSFDSGSKYKLRPSAQDGLRFQGKVERLCQNKCDLLDKSAGYTFDEVMCGPWIYYKDVHGMERYSQPDILLFSHALKQLVILECKRQHTRYAWGQYKHYQALLRLMYPDYQICGIEVCKIFDPMESYAVLVESLKPHTFDFAAYLWY